MLPEISVIIPNYNHSLYLKQRIDSVLNQTYQDFEIIILDDCSTDNSREIIESYRNNQKISHIVYNKINSGSPFKQWKKGINLAIGKYIWIAESDDLCECGLLTELLKLHHKFENIGIAYCKSYPIYNDDQISDYSDSWLKRVDDKRWNTDFFNIGVNECEAYLSIQCTIPNASAVLFKKEVFNNQIPNLAFKICGDWMTYVQILKTYNIAYSSKPLNYHRSHQNNARSIYGKIILVEQLEVMGYIYKNFRIKKTISFYKSLNEKVAQLITLIKMQKLSIKHVQGILHNMFLLDKLIAFRILKISAYKLFNVRF